MKTNSFLMVCVLGLLLLSYLEHKARPSEEQMSKQEVPSEPLVTVRSDEIVGIRVQDSHGCLMVDIERQAQAATEDLLGILMQARIVRRIRNPLSDLTAYGLVQPQVRISLLRHDRTIAQHVSIGNSNPLGSTMYAAVEGQPEVLLVGSYFLRAVDMMLSQVRGPAGSSDELACRP